MPFPAKNRNVARRFRQRVLAPVLGVFGAVAILCLVAVQFAASRSDRISTARQTREVQHALSDGLDELARTQEVAAVWDFLVQELRKPQPNWQWMDENVGLWLHRLFQHDQVFILNARNEPIYATSGGQRVPPSMYAAANPALRALVDRTRGDTSAKNNPHERLPGQPLNARNTVRTGPHAVHSTDLITLGGKPAAVSVMRIVPLTKAVRPAAPGQEPLLVSVRFLDGSFLKDLEENNLIKAARFALTSAVSETERALPVTSSAGAHLGFFIWQPELPEGVLVEDNEVVKTSLRELRKAGFRIALDDFGTGYSSLSYLRRFEVDKIKIDRSFVQPLGQAADSTAIVTAVVTLGHAMGLTVTAEGVETPEQLAILNAVGCNELQGFLFSRAVPREQLAELLSPPEDRAVA